MGQPHKTNFNTFVLWVHYPSLKTGYVSTNPPPTGSQRRRILKVAILRTLVRERRQRTNDNF